MNAFETWRQRLIAQGEQPIKDHVVFEKKFELGGKMCAEGKVEQLQVLDTAIQFKVQGTSPSPIAIGPDWCGVLTLLTRGDARNGYVHG